MLVAAIIRPSALLNSCPGIGYRKRLYGLSVVKWSRRKAAQRVHRAELLRGGRGLGSSSFSLPVNRLLLSPLWGCGRRDSVVQA
jgi:hypothetical protein